MKKRKDDFNLESDRTVGFWGGGNKCNSIAHCSTSYAAREGTSLFFYLMGLSAARVPHTCPLCVFSCRWSAVFKFCSVCVPHVQFNSAINTLQCAEIQSFLLPSPDVSINPYISRFRVSAGHSKVAAYELIGVPFPEEAKIFLFQMGKSSLEFNGYRNSKHDRGSKRIPSDLTHHREERNAMTVN
jgi:hypothetical protein